MQFATNTDGVNAVALKARTLFAATIYVERRGCPHDVWKVELYHDYYDSVNSRFRLNGSLVDEDGWARISSLHGFRGGPVSPAIASKLNAVSSALKRAWRDPEFGAAFPAIGTEPDSLNRVAFGQNNR